MGCEGESKDTSIIKHLVCPEAACHPSHLVLWLSREVSSVSCVLLRARGGPVNLSNWLKLMAGNLGRRVARKMHPKLADPKAWAPTQSHVIACLSPIIITETWILAHFIRSS